MPRTPAPPAPDAGHVALSILESPALLRALFESHPQPMWVYDLESLRILAVNDAAVARYGYSREEFVSLTLKDLRPDEDVPALLARIAATGSGPESSGVWRHRLKGGGHILADIFGHTLDFEGRRARLVIAQDVTAKVATEERLATAEGLLRVAGRVARIGGWSVELGSMSIEFVADLGGDERASSPLARLSIEEGLATFPPEHRARMVTLIERCGRDGAPFDAEAQIVGEGGEEVWLRVVGEASRAADGAITHVHGAFLDITELRASQNWSEERFRRLFDVIPTPLWSSRPDGTLDYANKLLYDYVGTTPAALAPSEWLTLVHPEDKGRVERVASAAYEEGRPYSCELRLRRRDGEFRWHLYSGAPLRTHDGEIVRWYGTFTEIHDIKAAQEAQRESESRFRQIAEHIGEVFWMTDLEKQAMLYISPAYEAIWGRTAASLYDNPRQWLSAIHDDDRARVLEALKLQPLGEYNEEYRVVRPDGEVRWIADRAWPIQDDDGEVYRVAGVARDITAKRKAQEQLGERIKELGLLYRSHQLTTHDGPSLDDTCKELVAALPAGFQHPEEVVARMVVDEVEHHSPGWRAPLEVLRAPLMVEDVESGLLEVGYVTAPEGARSTESAFLEEERTMIQAVALHVGRMLERRRMKEHLTQTERLKAIGALTGGIAHDFNNLLLVILGNAELLEVDAPVDSTTRQIASEVRLAAERAAELTRSLLAFGRRQPLFPTNLDVAPLLEGMMPLLHRTLGKGISVLLERPPGPLTLVADQAQLETALLNLALNARDAMPTGGTLTLRADVVTLTDAQASALQLEAGPFCRLQVEATGRGMRASVLKRAFEPFFTTKEVGQGSGLGLSMVHGLAKQSGGHAEIESEVGRGTTVTMLLPMARVLEEGPEPPRAPRAVLPQRPDTILVVEDNALVRRHVVKQLRALEYVVHEAEDAATAQAVLDTTPGIDLLFTDVVLPGGVSGPQLADAARETHPEIKVLFSSGYPGEELALEPSARLLSKPYRLVELAAALREALRA